MKIIDLAEAVRKLQEEVQGGQITQPVASTLEKGTENEAMAAPPLDRFIYVPSIKLYVQKEKQLFSKTWYRAHEELQKQGLRMPTIEEFRQFLGHLKNNPSQENDAIYNEITQVGDPWREEWLDAFFEPRQDGLYMLTDNKRKTEKLSDYLAKNKTPGISLGQWLIDANPPGLPRLDINKGDLSYWAPVSGRVASFGAGFIGADFGCGRDPDITYSSLGVRGVRS